MGKKYNKSKTVVDSTKKYSVTEAFTLLGQFEGRKFDETVDVAIRLGVDPKQGDQNVRGATALPHGTGKTVRVAVFAKGPKAEEAKAAGADVVGADDLVEAINGGKIDFDKSIATPDMMATVSKVAKVLGPRGLMPNPKLGTVTMDVAKAVKEVKGGKIEFKLDKAAIVHVPIGKRSFGSQKLEENFKMLLDAIVKAKPATSKGTYVKGIAISATMSPSVRLDLTQLNLV
jgi:large subunit ribosomal protein L1